MVTSVRPGGVKARALRAPATPAALTPPPSLKIGKLMRRPAVEMPKVEQKLKKFRRRRVSVVVAVMTSPMHGGLHGELTHPQRYRQATIRMTSV